MQDYNIPLFLLMLSVYILTIGSVKYVFKRSRHAFSTVRPKRVAGKVPTCVLECRLLCSFHFFMFKMVAYEGDLEHSNE